jgi:hypothetical protein
MKTGQRSRHAGRDRPALVRKSGSKPILIKAWRATRVSWGSATRLPRSIGVPFAVFGVLAEHILPSYPSHSWCDSLWLRCRHASFITVQSACRAEAKRRRGVEPPKFPNEPILKIYKSFSINWLTHKNDFPHCKKQTHSPPVVQELPFKAFQRDSKPFKAIQSHSKLL